MYKKMIDIRKISVILILSIIILSAAGCKKEPVVTETTTSDYVYHSVTTPTTIPEETATAENVSDESTSAEETSSVAGTYPSVEQSVSVTVCQPTTQVYVPVPATTVQSQTVPGSTQSSSTTIAAVSPSEQSTAGQTEVDLSITMPEANGKMKVYKTPSNKYIEKVSSSNGIDASRLCAVVSVPENDQNYVFEFSADSKRTVNDLKKVYLLDRNLNILNVAASNASQRVNLSTTENWFCMNVLIKGVIFPAIKDQF